MIILNAGYSVTLTLAASDGVTVNTRGNVRVEAVSGLGVAAGEIANASGRKTFGPYSAGQIKLTASGSDCEYAVSENSIFLPPARARSIVGSSALFPPKEAQASANTTWHLTTVAARAYHGIEVVYGASQSTYVTYDHTAVAASANLSSAITPTGAWNVGSSVTVAVGGTTDLPLLASTGLIACRALARNDGGRYPIAMVRSHSVSNTPSYAAPSNFAAAWDAANPDWPMQTYSQGGGDYASTSQASFSSTTRNGILIPAVLRFHYDVLGLTGLGIGDSLMGGDSVLDGSAQRQSYGYKAVRTLQDAGLPFDFVNSGISGNTFARFAPRGKAFIDLVKPDFALIPVFTPNDTYNTQAAIDAQWFAAMDLAAYAIAANVLPILVTPLPDNGNTVNTDNFRLQNRERALASGMYCFDTEPLVSDRASPARWLPGMNDAGNSGHYGALGGSTLGAGLAVLLRTIYY